MQLPRNSNGTYGGKHAHLSLYMCALFSPPLSLYNITVLQVQVARWRWGGLSTASDAAINVRVQGRFIASAGPGQGAPSVCVLGMCRRQACFSQFLSGKSMFSMVYVRGIGGLFSLNSLARRVGLPPGMCTLLLCSEVPPPRVCWCLKTLRKQTSARLFGMKMLLKLLQLQTHSRDITIRHCPRRNSS